MVNAGTAEAILTLNTGQFSSQLKGAAAELKGFGDKSESVGNRVKSLGSGVSGIGNQMTKGFTVPLVGAGMAVTKLGMDFETGMAQVSTIADTTKVSMGDLSKGIVNMSNDTGIATQDLTTSLYDAISSGVDTADAMGFVGEATKLAKGGFTSTTKAIDVLTTALNGYGLKASETGRINDVLIATQNLGKTTVDQLSESMGKVIPVAASNNVSIEQLGAAYANLTAKGIATAEAGTYIRSMLAELSKTGSDADKALRAVSGKSFAQLSAEGKSLGDVLNLLNGHAKKNNLTLKDMFGSVEAGTAAMVLATNDGKDFSNALDQMKGSAGSAEKAFKTMSETTQEKFKKSMNQLKNDAMELGVKLLPVAQKIIEQVSKLAQWFGNLSDSSKEMIIKVGLLVAAAGPLLSITGKLTSGVGSLIKIGSKVPGLITKITSVGSVASKVKGVTGSVEALSTGLGGVGKVATKAAGSVAVAEGGITGIGLAAKAGAILLNPLTLGIVAAGVGAVALGKQLSKDVIPQVDLFGRSVERAADGTYKGTAEISEGTKKAVSSYIDLDKEAQKALLNLKLNGSVITADIANDLSGKFSNMGKVITTELQNDYNKSLEVMQKFYSDGSLMTAEEQQKALDQLKLSYDNRKISTETAMNSINEITKRASQENRAISEEEWKVIDQHKQNMRTTAVNCLSEQEKESQIILDRLKAYDGRVTAEQAGEHVRLLQDQRVKAVDTANREYQERITVANQLKADGTEASRLLAEKIIQDAETQRTVAVDNATRIKNEGIDKLSQSYTDLRNNVDTNTGEVLTFWGRMKNWWEGWFPAPKEFKTYKTGYQNGMVPDNGYAVGTYSAMAGVRWVGEKGPELMKFNGGESIYNAVESQRIASNIGVETTDTKGIVLDESLKKLTNEVKMLTLRIKDVVASKGIVFNDPVINGVNDIYQISEELEMMKRSKAYAYGG